MRAPQTATIDWKNKNTNRRKKKSEREGRGKKENWKIRQNSKGTAPSFRPITYFWGAEK